MSASTAAFRRSSFVVPLVAGAASAVLYLSLALTFLFLLPLQIAFGRFGKSSGIWAIGLSAVLIACIQITRLYFVGPLVPIDIAATLVPPFVLIAAIGLLNAAFWEGEASPYRSFIVSALVAAIAAPALVSLGHDAGIMQYFEDRIAAFIAPLKNRTPGSGYDASVLSPVWTPRRSPKRP